MITGVLNTNSNAGIYITDEKRSKSVNVKPGQYLYLAVNDCWIPVVIRLFSAITRLGLSEF